MKGIEMIGFYQECSIKEVVIDETAKVYRFAF